MDLLRALPAEYFSKRIIGVTGPPGAGKSTLIDALIDHLIMDNKEVAVICIDPSSPFHYGALLGDRLRMTKWFNHPHVFIRSLASRGSLGGLSPKVIEITDLLKASGFDHIIVETVGVGQNEVEIAAIADISIVVFTPESGDDIQIMKAGLMEIADIIVVNKSDHPRVNSWVNELQLTVASNKKHIPIVKTIATLREGIEELSNIITAEMLNQKEEEKKYGLLAEKSYQLIQKNRMKDVSKKELEKKIRQEWNQGFNLYQFVTDFNNS